MEDTFPAILTAHYNKNTPSFLRFSKYIPWWVEISGEMD
jgi:hypothetical protein